MIQQKMESVNVYDFDWRNYMVIYLGCSLDDIFFGLAISDVIQLLGNPNKINEDEREGFIVYYYNKKMAKFYFSLEDHNKLYTIEVFHPDAYLWNQKVIGMRRSEIEDGLWREYVSYQEKIRTWSLHPIFYKSPL